MRLTSILIICIIHLSCRSQQKIDLLVYNGTVYTVDSSFSIAEAIAIKDGKIVEVGKSKVLENKFQASEKLDAQGKFIYPGFIDAHAHFLGYGFSLGRVDLVGTKSWEEIVAKIIPFAREHPHGWLEGYGWDQNDWATEEFPTNQRLNELFPDRPVLLTRIDGHAAIANRKALELASLKAGDQIAGGIIEVKNGQLTGVLVDNAVDLVSTQIPNPGDRENEEALLNAQKNCFGVGLTTVDDCGLGFPTILQIDSLQRSGALKMRLYIMLSDDRPNLEFALSRGKIKTDRLHVCSFKVYADGALGSRGACLLQPYDDRPGWSGFLLKTPSHYDSIANVLSKNGWQMCTHAIGDSGNRMILDTYGKYLKGKNDLRWRVEHAQVVNENDFRLFSQYSIVPSVQPTHATSDMYWAGERIGQARLKGAYAYKKLMEQNGWIALGTDFPVEDISPLKTFYAAVVRKDAKGWPDNGFQIDNALSREAALRGMTIWAARANFEETEKGSLEAGKLADFVMLDKDIMKVGEPELLQISVMATFLNGEKVFAKK